MTIPVDSTEFVVGQIVYLKSGSPAMTVRGVGEAEVIEGLNPLVHCVWIVNGWVQSGDFLHNTLTRRPSGPGFLPHPPTRGIERR